MAAQRDGEDERERLSWREIDQLRDRSRQGRREPGPPVKRRQQEKIRQEALKQAEALFAGKQQRPEYLKSLHALEDRRATPEFGPAAEKFYRDFGLPEDWRGLMLFLDHPDPGVVAQTLERLHRLAGSQSMLELQGLKGKLRTMSLTARSLDIKERAASLLQEL